MGCQQCYREAAEKVRVELAKPLCEAGDTQSVDEFDPWALFPCLYGSYSKEFDDMALLVLRNLEIARMGRWDKQERGETLAHEMFREMLCTADLCDYGTSPRACFVNTEFGELLSRLITKWQAYSDLHWNMP